MDKESTVPTAIAFIGFVAVVIFFVFMIINNVESNKQSAMEDEMSEVGVLPDIRILMLGKSYIVKSYSSKAVVDFQSRLPVEVELSDKDDNRKEGLTYFKIASEPVKVKKAMAGDVLLKGNSTIIVVTKSFKTSEKYTKIGHIDDMPAVPSGTIKAMFELVQ